MNVLVGNKPLSLFFCNRNVIPGEPSGHYPVKPRFSGIKPYNPGFPAYEIGRITQ